MPGRCARSESPSNLPGEVTSLVGRDEERAAVRDELRASRIVTLTGPGGSGKTRLALAVARDERAAFPHGTWFVDLAAIRDPARIEPTIAAAHGGPRVVRAAGRGRASGASPRPHVPARARQPRAAAPRWRPRSSPGSRATPARCASSSRAASCCGSAGARPPGPAARGRRGRRAVRRSRARAPSRAWSWATTRWTPSARSPSASVACRWRSSSPRPASGCCRPTQIRDRLEHSLDLRGGSRDLPERQQTLRAAIAWSDELLAEAERRLFARLGVFAGGWTAMTAEPVVNAAAISGVDVVDGLESLADKSLIRVEPAPSGAPEGDAETRFSLHPLLREYALERLAERGELAERRRRSPPNARGSPRGRRLDPRPVGRGRRCGGSIARSATSGRRSTGRSRTTSRHRPPDHRRDVALVSSSGAGCVRAVGCWRELLAAARRATRGCGSSGSPRRRPRLLDGRLRGRGPRLRGAARSSHGDRAIRCLMADAHYDVGFLSMVAQEGLAARARAARARAVPGGRPRGRRDPRAAGAGAGGVPRGRLRRGARPGDAEPRGIPPGGSQYRGRRQPHAAVGDRLAARRSPARLAKGVRGPAVLLGHGQRIGARPQPRRWQRSSSSPTATASSGRGSPERRTGWSARRA